MLTLLFCVKPSKDCLRSKCRDRCFCWNDRIPNAFNKARIFIEKACPSLELVYHMASSRFAIIGLESDIANFFGLSWEPEKRRISSRRPSAALRPKILTFVLPEELSFLELSELRLGNGDFLGSPWPDLPAVKKLKESGIKFPSENRFLSKD